MPESEPIAEDKRAVLKNLYGHVRDRWEAEDKIDVAAGKAVICPADGDACDFEYCQSFCFGEGCKNINKCWKVSKTKEGSNG